MIREMRRLAAAVVLVTSFLAGSSSALALIRSKSYTLRVVAGILARTVRLNGSGANLRVNSVRVNGQELTIGDGNGSGIATMYGDGVIVRFVERRHTHSASVVAIAGHPVVRIRYTVSG